MAKKPRRGLTDKQRELAAQGIGHISKSGKYYSQADELRDLRRKLQRRVESFEKTATMLEGQLKRTYQNAATRLSQDIKSKYTFRNMDINKKRLLEYGSKEYVETMRSAIQTGKSLVESIPSKKPKERYDREELARFAFNYRAADIMAYTFKSGVWTEGDVKWAENLPVGERKKAIEEFRFKQLQEEVRKNVPDLNTIGYAEILDYFLKEISKQYDTEENWFDIPEDPVQRYREELQEGYGRR